MNTTNAGKLQNRVALVTGAGRGIGRAIALKLAREGAQLVINDLDAAPLEETRREAEELGVKVTAIPGSVTESGTADLLVDAAVSGLGGLDIIVNNAGYTWDSVVQKMSDEQWQAMLDVHLTAPFRILRSAAPYLREAARREQHDRSPRFRKIVNVSSTSGIFGNPGQANYSAAKAGVIGLTKALSKEWGRYRVNVNCVAFGPIETRLTQALHDQTASIEVEGREIAVGISRENLQTMMQLIPIGRLGSVEEAAGAVSLFCYPESDYVSGQVLTCAGGLF